MTQEQREAVRRAMMRLQSQLKYLWRDDPQREAQAKSDVVALSELMRG